MGVFWRHQREPAGGWLQEPRAGNSYIQTVTWGSDCPIADTILTHSQSVQPDSDYCSDQRQAVRRQALGALPFARISSPSSGWARRCWKSSRVRDRQPGAGVAEH